MTLLGLLLAQSDPGGPTGPAGPPAPGTSPGLGPNLLFIALMAGLLVFMILSQVSRSKREKREREALMAGLTKNAKVMTVGGIYGTIVNVKENDVVLKVDESSNTKMTFRKTAIQQILSD